MTAPTARSRPTEAGVRLDWRGACHWSYARLECVHCQVRTNLRDAAGQPSHKTCAESAADDGAAVAEVGVLRSTGAAA